MKNEIQARDWDSALSSRLSFLDFPNLIHIKVPDSIGVEKAISTLRQLPGVEFAEPNVIINYDTDDTHFSKQWALNNSGQTGGTTDANIDAPEAWNVHTGSSDFVVAIIDSGIDFSHDDLSANIWTNPGETGGGKETDGVDNDGNGYIDDYRGWDFFGGDNNPTDTLYPLYHGTHVAGIIGAKGNNGEGIAGICWDVKLMILEFWSLSEAISAISYASNNGARVINASWGTPENLQSLYNAVNYARTKGVLFVAAAGNYSSDPDLDNDQYPYYPASYTLTNVIAVLATDHNDDITGYSHYGNTSVDLGAPGGAGDGTGRIYSTKPYDDYQYMTGTSMAAPHVTGAAALAWSKIPLMNYTQVKDRILEKTDYVPDLINKCVSDGRLNLYSIMYDSAAPSAPSNPSGESYSWQSIHIAWTDNATNEIGFEIQRQKSGEGSFTSIGTVGKNSVSYTDTTAYGNIVTYYKIRGYNMAGNSDFTDTLTYTIPATAPSAPSNLSAPEWCAEYNVQLTWNDNANNEQAFAVERCRADTEQWEEIGTAWTDPQVANPTITWTDTMVSTGTYNYRVVAKNPAGTSNYSNVIYVVVGIY